MEMLFSVQVEGIDYESGLSWFAGDKEKYLKIIKSVAEEGRKLCQQMCIELSKRDFKNYVIHVHALKGITKNIGANAFSEQAQALEFAGKKQQFQEIDAHHEEVINAFEKLAKGMDQLILAELKDKGEESNMEKPKIAKEELLKKLDQIGKNLKEYYRDAAWKIVKECLGYHLDNEILQGFQEMDRMIAMFQYEEPAKTAKELKERIQKQG